MKIPKIFVILLLIFSFSCKEKPAKNNLSSAPQNFLKTEIIYYALNEKIYASFVAYKTDNQLPKPVVMVIPEWWGLTDYAKNRAKQLADLGYFAMAVDFYGDGKTVDNPADAQNLATPLYKDAFLAKNIFDAAKRQLQNFDNADVSKIAVIGYCFGGAQALNMARQESSLEGVVSFHGNLMTGVKPNNNSVKILVCNGANDSFVSAEEIAKFKREMDSAKINYQFIDYANSLHSFTNPASTEIGKKFNMKIAYNKEADIKSWNDMKLFLKEIFK